MNLKLIVAALSMVAVNAHAEDSRVESRTKATGAKQIVAGTISSCSAPIPFTFDRATATVESSTRYLVCKEYVSYNAQVSGSFWNTSESEIAGSARKSYRLEWEQAGGSRFLSGAGYTTKKGEYRQHSISGIDYALAITSVVAECSNVQGQLASVSVPLQATNCAGQNLNVQQ